MVATRRGICKTMISLLSVGLTGCVGLIDGGEVRGGELLVENESGRRHTVSTTMVAVGGNESNRFESVDELESFGGTVVYLDKITGAGDVAAEYDATVEVDGVYRHDEQLEIEGEDVDVRITVGGEEEVSIDVGPEIAVSPE